MDSLVLGSLAKPIKARLVSLVVAVGEIESSNIHTGVYHLFQGFDTPASRSQGADDLRLACGSIGHSLDLGEVDVGTPQFRSVC